MSKKLNLLFLLMSCLIVSSMHSYSWAGTITLNFDSLPSAQGWGYQGTVPESTVMSIDGTALTVDTLGKGDINSAYFLLDVIDPNLPFSVSFRARTLEADTFGGFFFSAFVGFELYQAFVSPDTLRVSPTGIIFPFDGTQFHDFRIEIRPGVGYDFFLDDVFLVSGPKFINTISQNSIIFGEGSAFPNSNALAELTQFTFNQVPLPTTVFLLGSGLIALMGIKRRFRKR